jgi:hypothetical protein
MMVGFFNLRFDASIPAEEIKAQGSVHVH